MLRGLLCWLGRLFAVGLRFGCRKAAVSVAVCWTPPLSHLRNRHDRQMQAYVDGANARRPTGSPSPGIRGGLKALARTAARRPSWAIGVCDFSELMNKTSEFEQISFLLSPVRTDVGIHTLHL
jgi:hypothetical protein